MNLDRILAVDPSLTCTGWAEFQGCELVRCGIIPTRSGAPLFQRIQAPAAILGSRDVPPYLLVIEWPQIYTRTKSKGDPNDLLPVAAVAGAIISSVGALTVRMPKPSDWKGQVPKDVHNARVLKRLTPGERARFDAARLPKSLANNAIDAVGLGLWALGRMGNHAANSDQDPVSLEAHGAASGGRARSRG